MEIARTLRTLRQSKRWTLKQVSVKADLSLSYVSNVERGWRKPSLEALWRLARIYGVSTDYLLAPERADKIKCALTAKYAWLVKDLETMPKEKQAEVIRFVRFLSQGILKERRGKQTI